MHVPAIHIGLPGTFLSLKRKHVPEFCTQKFQFQFSVYENHLMVIIIASNSSLTVAK